jgi:phospholipase/carboxylesterase
MTNRLRTQPTHDPRPQSASTHSTASAVCTHGGDVCRHALFAPLHYERNYGYPLFVWLHSPGGDERQLRQVMPELSMRNYVAVAPRGTIAVETVADEDADDRGYRWAQDSDQIFLATKRVDDCIDLAAAKFHLKRERVFLAGAGCGGTMALRIALANPRRFAGAISIGGELPRGMAPLARVNQARSLPLLLMTGLTSQHYPQPRVNDDLRLLHSAGIAVTLRLYPFGDDIAPMMLSDVDRWVMQQICRESAGENVDAD